MSWCWERFLKEGDILFNYMINNFEDMFDGDTIKHFDIRYGVYEVIDFIKEMAQIDKIKWCNEIQNELIKWIRNEYNNNRLLNKNNWKPCRDVYHIVNMYLGYNKLFQYKQYYFQLAVDSDLLDCMEDCKYCNNNESTIHFELALYGWKDYNSSILQPDNIIILSDNMMPYEYWKQK